MEKIKPSKRPKSYRSTTEGFECGCGTIYVSISFDEDNNPVEMFAKLGKSGGCATAMLEAIGKSTSIGLRCGIEPKYFIKKYIGVGCPSPIWEDGEHNLSCVDVMGKALRNAVKEE